MAFDGLGDSRDQLGSGKMGRDIEADKSKITGTDPNLQVDVGAGNLGVEPPGFLEKLASDATSFLENYLGGGGVGGLFAKNFFSSLKEKFPDLEISTGPPQKPEGGDGPPPQIAEIVPPAFNPIEDMVGPENVAYSGVGADQLRKQLFPYMNFNQPTQSGITGLMGQYAGQGQGTGLMTGPFGMSNTQV